VAALLVASYYVWDTANSQKNRFRMQRNGTDVQRSAFPQLPWGTIHSPEVCPAHTCLAIRYCLSLLSCALPTPLQCRPQMAAEVILAGHP
jgi:Ergosterol biosynthesis ERG4/ERG24 family